LRKNDDIVGAERPRERTPAAGSLAQRAAVSKREPATKEPKKMVAFCGGEGVGGGVVVWGKRERVKEKKRG
jgi:uncharacterized protein YifE (UPF0438 family)